jgi:CubicO group peptidase (beta-lactamase class C family)
MTAALPLLVGGIALAPFALAFDGSVPASDSTLEARIEAYVRPYVESNNFSGALLVARAGKVVVRRAWGYANVELHVPNTPDTRFQIASVSKSFTAAAILLLEERGRLRVDDPLDKHLPGYPNGDRIRILHLLTHTSGIPNVNAFPEYDERARSPQRLEDIVAWFRDRPLDFEPGARYAYSNSNYNLLALLIERVSGRPYGVFLKEALLDPLGLSHTAHHGDAGELIPERASGYVPVGFADIANAPYLDWSIKTGNGSLYSTVDDLLRWERSLAEPRLLGTQSLRRMFTDHGAGAGYGWFIRSGDHPSVAITGRAPGFSASVERFTNEDLTVILASNLYSSITQAMAADVAALALGEDRKPLLPASPVHVPDALQERYVGRYQFGADFRFNPNMMGEVRRVPGGLMLVMSGGGGTSHLIPLAEDRFLDRAYGGVVRFVSGTQGDVVALLWNFGQDYRAERIATSR